MATTVPTCSRVSPEAAERDVPLWRLHVLRAMYLLLAVGLGAMVVPEILSHELTSRGVIPSLLGAVWLLSLLALRYPLAMLPVLMFELLWKAVWMVAYGLPLWFAGKYPPTFAEDFFNIAFGAILLLVIPWGHVWRCYVQKPAERWR